MKVLERLVLKPLNTRGEKPFDPLSLLGMCQVIIYISPPQTVVHVQLVVLGLSLAPAPRLIYM